MLVSRVYIEEYIKTFQKFYFSLVVNSATASVMLLLAPVTPNGDDDIVEMATHAPSQILKIDLGFEKSIHAEALSRIADFMQFHGKKSQLKSFINKLLDIFYNYDATKLEINPIGIDKNDTLWALDAKIIFDDNALYRHPDILRLRPMAEIEEREVVVAKFGFDYKELNTGIGIITNGNGVALNIITEAQKCYADIACSLNIKGGVDRDKIAASIKLIMTNPSVDGIFIDIVGGFTRCNLVADGIIAVANDLGLNIPIVVRFEGTNKDEAVNILNASQLAIQIADSTHSGLALSKEAIAEDL
jgi:succinyl-CoA synthetase beta subunit